MDGISLDDISIELIMSLGDGNMDGLTLYIKNTSKVAISDITVGNIIFVAAYSMPNMSLSHLREYALLCKGLDIVSILCC